jgi:DNA modification methylase
MTVAELLKNHPAADAWPMMDDQRYEELRADIQTNGQREPITLCDGMILDGRNRYRACVDLCIDPQTRDHDGNPWEFAWSLNGERRDMDKVVRALVRRVCHIGSAEWESERKKIQDNANRKRSDAATEQHKKSNPRRGETLVADTKCPRPKSGKHVARETLASEAGVSLGTASKAEQISKHPELEKKVRLDGMKPTEALREIRSEKRRKELEQAVEAAKKQHSSDRPLWSLLNMDVLDGLEAVRDEHGPSRLIFTDPPYNIGIDYGDGEKADLLTPQAYMKWVRQWFSLCWDCLTDDGSLWVMIGDEYAAEYCTELKATGFTVRSWIKWYETFGVNCSNKFNRTSRHIFYAVKDSSSFVFNPEPVTRPSDRQTKYGDSRAAAGGKIWDDVWQIPRLTGTCAERIPDFPTQLPLALVEPIVLCASMPGDLVVDPFNGSGTTGVASVRNGRKYVGVEKSEAFADMATMRLEAT